MRRKTERKKKKKKKNKMKKKKKRGTRIQRKDVALFEWDGRYCAWVTPTLLLSWPRGVYFESIYI